MTTGIVAREQPVTMIEAHAPVAAIRRTYNFLSYFYAALAAPLERKARMLALERAAIRAHDRVLEVAVGPGVTFHEILKRVDRTQAVSGVDLSPKMLEATRQRAQAAGYANVDLREADARALPFADGTFDVLYNSYMLDLIPLAEMSVVLSEFWRVLKPGGRLALTNFSKRDGSKTTWAERFYSALPIRWVPYLTGGCRPVVMAGLVTQAGFEDVQHEFVPGIIPSEVVMASKTRVS